MKHFSKKLAAYSATAITLLAAPDHANGQRYFHNVDPDELRFWDSWPDTDIEIDLEFDGLEDTRLIVEFSSGGVSYSLSQSLTYKYSGDLQFATYTAVRPAATTSSTSYLPPNYWPPVLRNVPQPLPYGFAITETMNWGDGNNFFWKNQTGDGPGIIGIQGKPDDVYLAFRRLGLVDTVYGWLHVNFDGGEGLTYGMSLLDYGFQTGLDIPFSTGDTAGAIVIRFTAPIVNDLAISDYCSSTDDYGIAVNFTRPGGDFGLPGYEIFLVEESLADSFDLASAELATPAKFISRSDFEIGPYRCTWDANAQPIIGGKTYRAFVLSLGDPASGIASSLSEMSEPLLCAPRNFKPLVSFDTTNLNLSDNSPFENVKFEFVPRPHLCIDTFRVGIVPSLYPLTTNEFYDAPAGNYVEVPNDGSESFTVDFSGKSGLLNALEIDVDYDAYVLTISSSEFPERQLSLSDSIPLKFSGAETELGQISIINGFIQISDVRVPGELNVYSSDGRRVLTSKVTNGNFIVALGKWSAGIYLITLHNSSQAKTLKFVR